MGSLLLWPGSSQSVIEVLRFQLVGITSTTLDGGQGVIPMFNACQAEFSRSRVCRRGEVEGTTVWPPLPDGEPRLAFVFSDLGPKTEDDDCAGWTNATNAKLATALNLDTGGLAMTAYCPLELRVACCALVPDIGLADPADVDGDGEVTVKDTVIARRKVAGEDVAEIP